VSFEVTTAVGMAITAVSWSTATSSFAGSYFSVREVGGFLIAMTGTFLWDVIPYTLAAIYHPLGGTY
jgi:hypothetical protein